MGIPFTALLSTVAAAALLVPGGATVPEGASLPEIEQQTCTLALAMLSPYLATVDGYPPQIYVIGRARWLGCLLAGLPPAAVVLVDAGGPAGAPRHRWLGRLGLAPHNTLALILVDDAALLAGGWRWPARLVPGLAVRTLVWATAAPQDELAGLQLVRDFAKTVLLACVYEVRVALTAPDGTTYLYSGFTSCGEGGRTTASELDRWTAGAGRWLRGADLFLPACETWRPPSEGQPMSIFVARQSQPVGAIAVGPGEDIATRSLMETLRLTPSLRGFALRQTPASRIGDALRAGQLCRMDLMASMQTLQTALHAKLTSYAWGMTNMVAVVPAGLGRQPGLLHQLTDEFSASMWCATGVSTLVVAVCLVVLAVVERRADVLLPPLQSLALLLGQGAPGGSDQQWTPRQRSLLGSWMLVCVVVGAAYTDQLLSNLTVVSPHYEIDSIEALAESKLHVLVTPGTSPEDFPLKIRHKMRLASSGHNVSAILERIAERRDSATFLDSSNLPLLVPLLRHPRKVFAFKAPMERLTTFFLSSPGSPFEGPLQRTLARLRAAGMVVYWLRVSVEEFVRSYKFLEAERVESGDPQDAQEILDNYYLVYRKTPRTRPPQPLGASHAQPAFIFLGVGLGVATIVFSLEVTPWNHPMAAVVLS